MSNLACRFIITSGTNERNAKLGQRGLKGLRDLLLKFWNPSICREWLKLETSNLACRFITRRVNEKNKIKEVEKRSRDLLLTFWHPFISLQRSSYNTAVDRAILSKFGFRRDLNIAERVLLLNPMPGWISNSIWPQFF